MYLIHIHNLIYRETETESTGQLIKLVKNFIMGEKRKVSVNILGTKLSFKLPKVKMFKKKKCDKEPEWSWQSVAPQHHHQQVYQRQHHHHQQQMTAVMDMKQLKHRFLTSEQVNHIQTWLSTLPQPGDVEDVAPLLEESLSESVLSNISSPRRHNRQVIHTEIF